MRIIFMGTPAFAVPALHALIGSSHEVVAAYSQPPRPAGRGMKLTPSPIQQLAEQHGIPVFTPTSLKTEEAQQAFREHRAEIAAVAAYGLLLPQAILDAPTFGCLNIHPSELPRWRGAAPIQRTIMAGDTATACCIMQMEAGLDTGPVLAREPYSIAPGTHAGQLHDAMAELGATLLLETINAIAAGKPPIAKTQSTVGITYAGKLTKADQPLDWSRPADALLAQILGLAPAPGATTQLHGETVKVFSAQRETGDINKPSGIALDDRLLINAGNGTALRLTELQRPNKQRQSATQFLQGFTVESGTYAQ